MSSKNLKSHTPDTTANISIGNSASINSASLYDSVLQHKASQNDSRWAQQRDTYIDLVAKNGELFKLREEVAKLEASVGKKAKELQNSLKVDDSNKIPLFGRMTKYCDDLMSNIPTQDNGFFLWSMLGSISVVFLTLADKVRYKQQYERFKLALNIFAVVLTLTTWLAKLPSIFLFSTLVWYYFTLTLRENILIRNGSKIKRWWLLHHYITIIVTFILMTWPPGLSFENCRDGILFNITLTTIIQLIQFMYQRRTLQTKAMLSKKKDVYLSTTDEGVHILKRSRELIYMVPMLIFLYMFQAYMAWALYVESTNESCIEYQVSVLSVLFLVLCIGNCWTLFQVMRDKLSNHSVAKQE